MSNELLLNNIHDPRLGGHLLVLWIYLLADILRRKQSARKQASACCCWKGYRYSRTERHTTVFSASSSRPTCATTTTEKTGTSKSNLQHTHASPQCFPDSESRTETKQARDTSLQTLLVLCSPCCQQFNRFEYPARLVTGLPD